MTATTVGIVTFAFTFGGALVGMWLRYVLPPHHLDAESKDTIKVGVGLIATMSALVLGLVTASAKSGFDDVNTTVKHSAVDILALDRTLARYGPEAAGIRPLLKELLANRLEALWPQHQERLDTRSSNKFGTVVAAERLADAIRGLHPRDEAQRGLQSRALELTESLLKTRWAALAETTTVPLPFLVVLLLWLSLTFASFGLFAPRHTTVIVVLFVCAVSVAGALFLVLELDGPFDGLVRVSADPLRRALGHLGQ
jgi:hypothetical protein